MRQGQDESPVYRVRPSEAAARQIEEEWLRLAESAGVSVADAWRNGVCEAFAGLATLQERCSLALEADRCAEAALQQFLYRRRRGGPAWRILFTVHSADEDDPPTVRVHQVRHGAQAPLTEWPPDEANSS